MRTARNRLVRTWLSSFGVVIMLVAVWQAILLPPMSASAQSGITGLDFPGSAGVSNTMRFRFSNPQNNGLPIYGPGGNGITYIWRAFPRQQVSYYTAFFWGNDGNFIWANGNADSYYGAHPYPRGGPNGNTHDWEIAVETAAASITSSTGTCPTPTPRTSSPS
jgi:hypothetical protein